MTFRVKLRQYRLYNGLVPGLSRSNKIVIGQIEFGDEGFPNRSQVIAICLWAFAFCHGRLLNFLPMLIQPCEKEHSVAETSMRTSDYISSDFLVRMAQMGCAVDVVDGRREVEL